MKLRNKKTGEIGNAIFINADSADYARTIRMRFGGNLYVFRTMKEMMDRFGDYEPAEPLIKDEKIRKAVRAWAEADGADEKIYLTIDENGSRFANKYGGYIEFGFMIDMEERLYTIAELCGEEEE
jgi:hypothetical protein